MARFLEHTHRLTYRIIGVLLLTGVFAGISLQERASGQSSTMDWKLRPDLWWNSMDGIRPGVQIKGWETGPSRHIRRELDAGFWVATRWPEHPFSYRIQWSEPIPVWTGRQSGAAIGLLSSHRTGIRTHAGFITARWNVPSVDRRLLEVDIRYEQMRRTDPGYRFNSGRWQSDWNNRLILRMDLQSTFRETIWQSVTARMYHQFQGDSFQGADLRWTLRTPKRSPWGMESTLRFGSVGSSARPEFRYGIHSGQAIEMLNDPLWRARGTLPSAGITSGFLHPVGGLFRGYGKQEQSRWANGELPLWRNRLGGEWRVWTPNPVQQALREIETVREFMTFRTHLFFTSGYLGEGISTLQDGWYHEGGPGIEWRLEIPKSHTGFQGFSIRYDIPLWISRPVDDDHFQFRHSLGVYARFDL